MDGTQRKYIKKGSWVFIVQKHHQGPNILTRGQVQDILTSKQVHPRGIKVRLTTGEVGRVQIVKVD